MGEQNPDCLRRRRVSWLSWNAGEYYNGEVVSSIPDLAAVLHSQKKKL